MKYDGIIKAGQAVDPKVLRSVNDSALVMDAVRQYVDVSKNLRVVSKAKLNGPAVLHGHGPSDSRDCKHSKTIFFAAAVQAPKNPAWALYNKIPIIHQFTQVSTAHSMPLELIAIPSVTAPFHFLFRSAAGLHNCSAQW